MPTRSQNPGWPRFDAPHEGIRSRFESNERDKEVVMMLTLRRTGVAAVLAVLVGSVLAQPAPAAAPTMGMDHSSLAWNCIKALTVSHKSGNGQPRRKGKH